jgi:hypothetical protein
MNQMKLGGLQFQLDGQQQFATGQSVEGTDIQQRDEQGYLGSTTDNIS